MPDRPGGTHYGESRASSRSITASDPSSKSPPYRVNVKATLLWPAHSDTSRTLQPAATMCNIAVTKTVERDVFQTRLTNGRAEHPIAERPKERSAAWRGEQ